MLDGLRLLGQKLDDFQREVQREGQRSELLGSKRGGGHPGLSDEPYTDEPAGYDRDQRSRLIAGTETLNDGELCCGSSRL